MIFIEKTNFSLSLSLILTIEKEFHAKKARVDIMPQQMGMSILNDFY